MYLILRAVRTKKSGDVVVLLTPPLPALLEEGDMLNIPLGSEPFNADPEDIFCAWESR